ADPIAVSAGGTAKWSALLSRRGEVRIRVVRGAERLPAEGVRGVVTPARAGGASEEDDVDLPETAAVSGADGRLRIGELEEGNWNLQLVPADALPSDDIPFRIWPGGAVVD